MKSFRRLVIGRRLSLQRRLTLLTTLAVAVTLAATCLIGWLALRETLWSVHEHGSLLIAQDLAPLAHDDVTTTHGLTGRLLGPGSAVVEAVESDGTILLVPGENTTLRLGAPEVEAARLQTSTARDTTNVDGAPYRLVTVPFGEPGCTLVVARPLAPAYEILHVFGLVVLLVGAAGILWAAMIGRAVARTALAPVRGLTRAVAHITKTEDLRPIATDPYTGGEVAALTETFNQMLHRIASAREQQDRLVADASHELRTPLTSMRTNIDLLALDAGSGLLGDAGRTLILSEVQTQMADFTIVITDLLDLTHTKVALEHELVDLSAVIARAAGHARRQSPDLTVDVDGDFLQIVGDEHSLQRAVTNVLDNAVKWSPPGGTIQIHTDGHQLRITDQGPGIADADLPHIFDRFYRAETARSTAGTGLGLAIAAKAIHDHGGTIEAGRSSQGGAQLTIELPGATTPQLTALT